MNGIETWKPIPGYEGLYEVSDLGRVRSLDRVDRRGRFWLGRTLKPQLGTSGYLAVALSRHSCLKTRAIHRLVLEAFIGPCPKGLIGLHLNDIKTDNRLENLRWGTYSENNYDSVRNGRHGGSRKTRCPQGHSLKHPNIVKPWRKDGSRACRSCSNARSKMYRFPQKFDLQELSDEYYNKIMSGVA